ncbi:MAG TPA: dihydrolipoamide acetyltransferase family protein [Gaiellaceae bacterium]|nr:dihydrolipoamide acetyltransferase family protein [Gaiellaceae bacterium]
MPAELAMPKLSDSEADAVVLRWLKAPGEGFRRGEGLLEVETDKATVVYEAEEDGTIDAILVAEGETVAVGQPIARLAGRGAEAAEPLPAPAATTGAAAAGVHPNATPVARRTAVELGVSLHHVAGTGPGGRITREDVRRAGAGAPGPAPARTTDVRGDVRVIELTPTQATIARRMAQSAAEIPSFTVSADADVSEIVALRRGVRKESAEAPSLNDFIVKAAALALREFPRLNASYLDGRIECYSRVNVGVAVAADEALLVPVVADADRRALAEIAAETRRLAEGARSRSLGPDELQGGTFTVSNLGMFGVRSFTAIVDLPQTAILAVGSVRRAPVEDGGGVVFRDVMTLTLTCDHRVVYGADGARFLSRLCELLERPLVLTL